MDLYIFADFGKTNAVKSGKSEFADNDTKIYFIMRSAYFIQGFQ